MIDFYNPNVTVAMLGARRHYAIPRLLHEAGLLEQFFTDSYSGNQPRLRRLLATIPQAVRPRALERWLGRSDAVLPAERVVSFEALGWWYAIALRRARTPDERRVVVEACVQRFAQVILTHPKFATSGLVWGFNGAALTLFKHAKQQGRLCILDQTSYPRRLSSQLHGEEPNRWPGWEARAQDPMSFRPTHLEGPLPEEEEWALADRIVCGSEFVRYGLIQLGVTPEKIRVVPYGVDPNRFAVSTPAPDERLGTRPSRPLRVLFAGQVGLWKGVPDLLQALRQLPPMTYEARLAGRLALEPGKIADSPESVHFLGAVPRAAMDGLYRWADVFVCPSLSEGSAAVTYEALMSGVPVIATPNAGSPVRDGVDGFIVPIRDPQALAAALRRYLDDPELLRAHRAAATQDRHRLGLEAYREHLVSVIHGLAT